MAMERRFRPPPLIYTIHLLAHETILYHDHHQASHIIHEFILVNHICDITTKYIHFEMIFNLSNRLAGFMVLASIVRAAPVPIGVSFVHLVTRYKLTTSRLLMRSTWKHDSQRI